MEDGAGGANTHAPPFSQGTHDTIVSRPLDSQRDLTTSDYQQNMSRGAVCGPGKGVKRLCLTQSVAKGRIEDSEPLVSGGVIKNKSIWVLN